MKTSIALVGLLCSGLFAPGAMAQTQGSPAAPVGAGQFMTQLAPGQRLASDLMGKEVYGSNNDELGEIDDIILDRSGRVAAMIVELDDAPGIGDREIAIPMDAIRLGPGEVSATGSVGQQSSGQTGSRSSNEERIIITTPMEQLRSAPAFEDDDD